MVFRILTLLLLPVICLAQINSNGEKPTGELLSNERSPIEMKRNASFNLEEIKVRWKKAALENCAGVTCAPAFSCGTSTITDIDENEYSTVTIGTQCWMGQNLKVSKYNDGTAIDLDASGGMLGYLSQTWSIRVAGAYTIYENDIINRFNVTKYGFLYNWYTVIDSRKLCPIGWHVPIENEWDVLVAELGGPTVAGGKLKSTAALWNNGSVPVPGNNESGFFANPGGFRNGSAGDFMASGSNAFFWSATEISGVNSAFFAQTFNLGPGITAGNLQQFKTTGESVRCLKD